MKNLKKLLRAELKTVVGGNPRPPGGPDNNTCRPTWILCTMGSGEVVCVSPSQYKYFCVD